MGEQGRRAARRQADRPVALARMVRHGDGHAAARQGAQRQEGVVDGAGLVLAAQEGAERVEDRQVDAVLLAQGQDAVDQRLPFGGRGDREERPQDEADLAAEIEAAGAFLPDGAWLFGDDDGAARLDRQAGQRAAVLAAGQQQRQQGRLAELAVAGEERHVTRGDDAVPQPIGWRGDVGRQLMVPDFAWNGGVGHGIMPPESGLVQGGSWGAHETNSSKAPNGTECDVRCRRPSWQPGAIVPYNTNVSPPGTDQRILSKEIPQ